MLCRILTQIITPPSSLLVGLGLGLGVGEGRGDFNEGVIIWQGVENVHNAGLSIDGIGITLIALLVMPYSQHCYTTIQVDIKFKKTKDVKNGHDDVRHCWTMSSISIRTAVYIIDISDL